MNDELEKTERLFQQLGGNSPEEDLNHLKVYIQGDKDGGKKIITYLLSLDTRVNNYYCYDATNSYEYYFIDLNDDFTISREKCKNALNDYDILSIYDLVDYDEIEKENIEENDEEEKEYCPSCDEEITVFNNSMFYTDGDRCCESCYDEDLDDEECDDEECEQSYTPQVSDLESSELMYRQLSETNSNPKEIINSKLSELSSLSRRRRR